MTKQLISGLALATALCTASPMTSEPASKAAPAPVSQTLEAKALRTAGRIIYNVHSIDMDKALLPQAIAVATPEPNANFLIGAGLIGIAYLLNRKKQKSQ
jgi:hypothetical protein